MHHSPSTVHILGMLLGGVGLFGLTGIIGDAGAFAADVLATVPPPSTPEGDRRYRLVLAIVGAVVLLAGLTGLVLARRQVGESARALVDAVLAPGRRARRQRTRERLGQMLIADVATGTVVRDALDEIAPLLGRSEATHLYSVVATADELTAQVTATDAPPHPWTIRADGRWVRPHRPVPRPGTPGLRFPRLVRVGVADEGGGTVLVDLAQLDGVLSITGADDVARDLLALLVHDLLSATGIPPLVAVLDPQGVLPPHPRAAPVRTVGELLDGPRPTAAPAVPAVVAVATPRPEAPILVLPALPTNADAAAVAALCAPGHGWNALVVGDVPGAHWRWTTSPDGTVDLGLLGMRITVPVVRR